MGVRNYPVFAYLLPLSAHLKYPPTFGDNRGDHEMYLPEYTDSNVSYLQIAGTGSCADLRFETRERRIIDARHNGRSCCSLPSAGSSCPFTCVHNPEAFAGARTQARRNIGKILCRGITMIAPMPKVCDSCAPNLVPILLKQYSRSTSVGPPGWERRMILGASHCEERRARYRAKLSLLIANDNEECGNLMRNRDATLMSVEHYLNSFPIVHRSSLLNLIVREDRVL